MRIVWIISPLFQYAAQMNGQGRTDNLVEQANLRMVWKMSPFGSVLFQHAAQMNNQGRTDNLVEHTDLMWIVWTNLTFRVCFVPVCSPDEWPEQDGVSGADWLDEDHLKKCTFWVCFVQYGGQMSDQSRTDNLVEQTDLTRIVWKIPPSNQAARMAKEMYMDLRMGHLRKGLLTECLHSSCKECSLKQQEKQISLL